MALRGGNVPVTSAQVLWYAKTQRSNLVRKPVRLGKTVVGGEENDLTHKEETI